MAFATDNLGRDVIPGTVENTEGSIPPPPGFEVAPSAPNFDVLTGTQSPEVPATETAPVEEVAPVNEDVNADVTVTTEEPAGDIHAFSKPHVEEAPAVDVAAPTETAEMHSVDEASSSEKQITDTVTHSRVFSRRVDQPNAEFVVGRPRNPNLNYAMELFFSSDNPNGGQVDDILPIQGEIINKTGGYGLWEEGGSTGPEARAIFATNPDGSAPVPFYVFDKNSVVNGKHALVPIEVGSYIVLGGRKANVAVVLVYKVMEINDNPAPGKEGMIIPSYKSQLVAYLSYDTNLVADAVLQCIAEEGSKECSLWTTGHPAIKAMQKRLFQLHANIPAYIVEYQENRFDSVDYNDCLSDAEFMGRMTTEPSLQEAYEKVGEVLGAMISNGVAPGEHPHLVVSLNYVPKFDTVAVFCIAKVYDMNNKSSRGKRLCFSRALLTAGSSFYYPDKSAENAVTFDRLKEVLTKVGGAMASSFRRRTGI